MNLFNKLSESFQSVSKNTTNSSADNPASQARALINQLIKPLKQPNQEAVNDLISLIEALNQSDTAVDVQQVLTISHQLLMDVTQGISPQNQHLIEEILHVVFLSATKNKNTQQAKRIPTPQQKEFTSQTTSTTNNTTVQTHMASNTPTSPTLQQGNNQHTQSNVAIKNTQEQNQQTDQVIAKDHQIQVSPTQQATNPQQTSNPPQTSSNTSNTRPQASNAQDSANTPLHNKSQQEDIASKQASPPGTTPAPTSNNDASTQNPTKTDTKDAVPTPSLQEKSKQIDKFAGSDNKKVVSLIMDQMKELVGITNAINKKTEEDIKKTNNRIDSLSESLETLQKSTEDLQTQLGDIQKYMDRFIGLYEVVTNQYNPFIEDDTAPQASTQQTPPQNNNQ